MVRVDWRQTIKTENAISISRENVENSLYNKLGMTNVSARCVKCLMTQDECRSSLITSLETETDPGGFVQCLLMPVEFSTHH